MSSGCFELIAMRDSAGQEIVITRNGKPAGVLIDFGSEDDWLDYQLENNPRFPRRIEGARKSLPEGRGIRIKDVERRCWLPGCAIDRCRLATVG